MPLSPKQKAKARSIEEQLARKWWNRLFRTIIDNKWPITKWGGGIAIAGMVLWRLFSK